MVWQNTNKISVILHSHNESMAMVGNIIAGFMLECRWKTTYSWLDQSFQQENVEIITCSTCWVSFSRNVSSVTNFAETCLSNSASLSSMRLFFEARELDISFKISYIAPVAFGMYLQIGRNLILGLFRLVYSHIMPEEDPLAQTTFPLQLLTSLNSFHYFEFELGTALLNSCLETKWC